MYVCKIQRAMDVPLIAAGCLAVLGAAIHGVAGEIARGEEAARRRALPANAFGGPRTTKTMIQRVLAPDDRRLPHASAARCCWRARSSTATRPAGWPWCGAGASTGFAALVLGLGVASEGSPRLLGAPPALPPCSPSRRRWRGGER